MIPIEEGEIVGVYHKVKRHTYVYPAKVIQVIDSISNPMNNKIQPNIKVSYLRCYSLNDTMVYPFDLRRNDKYDMELYQQFKTEQDEK